MRYWCSECEDYHEVTEIPLPRGMFDRPRPPPRDSLAVIKDSLTYLFQWIEDVKVEAKVKGTVLCLTIKHSYPKGISIKPNVKQWLDANLAPNVTAKVTYRRIAPVKRGR